MKIGVYVLSDLCVQGCMYVRVRVSSAYLTDYHTLPNSYTHTLTHTHTHTHISQYNTLQHSTLHNNREPYLPLESLLQFHTSAHRCQLLLCLCWWLLSRLLKGGRTWGQMLQSKHSQLCDLVHVCVCVCSVALLVRKL